jgi:hypothetical protein
MPLRQLSLDSRVSSSIFRALSVLLTFSVLCPVVASDLVPINPAELSSPPYSYLQTSVRRLQSGEVQQNRYLTFLGTWENNGEANWERSSWWGRFFIDCKSATFQVAHFRHSHIGREWRFVGRNYTALFAYEKLCPSLDSFSAETKTINDLRREFTKEAHDSSSPFRAVY